MKKKLSRSAVILLCMLQLCGCTSMRTMEPSATSLEEKLKVGDHLIIYEKSGRVVDMTLTAIEAEVLYGTLSWDSTRAVEVKFSDASKIERESVDGGKTVLAVVGGGVALYYILSFIFLIAILG